MAERSRFGAATDRRFDQQFMAIEQRGEGHLRECSPSAARMTPDHAGRGAREKGHGICALLGSLKRPNGDDFAESGALSRSRGLHPCQSIQTYASGIFYWELCPSDADFESFELALCSVQDPELRSWQQRKLLKGRMRAGVQLCVAVVKPWPRPNQGLPRHPERGWIQNGTVACQSLL